MGVYTGTQNKLIKGENNVCDQCGCIEDHTHVLCCWASLAMEFREELLHELSTSLSKLDSYPGLVTIFLYGDRNINGCVLLNVTRHPEEIGLGALIREQNKIGQFFFFMGFWSQGWQEVQENSFMSPIKAQY